MAMCFDFSEGSYCGIEASATVYFQADIEYQKDSRAVIHEVEKEVENASLLIWKVYVGSYMQKEKSKPLAWNRSSANGKTKQLLYDWSGYSCTQFCAVAAQMLGGCVNMLQFSAAGVANAAGRY